MSITLPSMIVNEIYSIMDEYETEGLDLYNVNVIEVIEEYLSSLGVVYATDTNEWPDENGGVCAVAFVEKGHQQLIMFDYKY